MASNLPDSPPAETLARLIRHEVGDLLQVIYSFVGLMQERVAPDGLERRLLADLKGRAETCRQELDAAVDLVCSFTIQPTALDLTTLTGSLLTPLRRRFPTRHLELLGPVPVAVRADPQRLGGAISLLLTAACHEAARHVLVKIEPTPTGVRWSVRRDGLPPAAEQTAWLEQPFSSTRHALFGLSVTLARRVAEAHGGSLEAEHFPQGGIELRMILPNEPVSPQGKP